MGANNHPTTVPSNAPSRPGAGRGRIEFNTVATDAYKDLIRETLEQSEFIETEWEGSSKNVLIAREVDNE